jgi:hypothetical protein
MIFIVRCVETMVLLGVVGAILMLAFPPLYAMWLRYTRIFFH